MMKKGNCSGTHPMPTSRGLSAGSSDLGSSLDPADKPRDVESGRAVTKKEQIVIELPVLSDEAAASLQNFIYELMYLVDEQYHRQIHRHYRRNLDKLMVNAEPTHENLSDPPF